MKSRNVDNLAVATDMRAGKSGGLKDTVASFWRCEILPLDQEPIDVSSMAAIDYYGRRNRRSE
jgi:hypothetical protein